MKGQEIGDYWQETLVSGSGAGNTIWHVRARTSTFTRHCELDAIKAAEDAVKELTKYRQKQVQKQKVTFQRQVEFIMEEMLPYYEDIHDIAKEVAMWADDYVSMTEQLAKP
jgi:hypothetical protein